jgi:hypothetical protein
MKVMKKLAVLLSVMFIVSACAGAAVKPYEKYDLDDQLEPASEILRYNLMGWEKIDSQSFVLQTSPSQFYLIVLVRPSDRLLFTESISITNTGNMVKPGYDKVIVMDESGDNTFVIYKMYKLKDRQEANEIEEQLSN